MRALFLTSLYSSPLQPAKGIPNARIARAMRRHAEVRVIAPVPYYPRALVRNRPDLAMLAEMPFIEKDDEGSEILHPRYAHLPRVGRALYASLYAGSIARVVSTEVTRFRPDVILSAWAYPDGVAAVGLAKLFGVPSVLRVMGSDINSFGLEPSRRPQIQWALRQATRIIAVSSALRDACVELGRKPGDSWSGENIDVIHTGVDSTRFFPVDRDAARSALGLPSDRRIIVVPARHSLEKGVDYFIEALAFLEPNCLGVLVGDGPQGGALRASVARLGLADRVRFVGQEAEARMRLYYSAADLVCLPSLEEGWPNVLLESYACGCPWVASRVGGVPELSVVAPGATLATPADAVDLARALKSALSATWDREKIAIHASSLSLQATARAYVDTCERAARCSQKADARAAGSDSMPRATA